MLSSGFNSGESPTSLFVDALAPAPLAHDDRRHLLAGARLQEALGDQRLAARQLWLAAAAVRAQLLARQVVVEHRANLAHVKPLAELAGVADLGERAALLRPLPPRRLAQLPEDGDEGSAPLLLLPRAARHGLLLIVGLELGIERIIGHRLGSGCRGSRSTHGSVFGRVAARAPVTLSAFTRAATEPVRRYARHLKVHALLRRDVGW